MIVDSELDELEEFAESAPSPSAYFKSGRTRQKAVEGAKLFAQKGNASMRRFLRQTNGRKKAITLPKLPT